MAVSLLRAITRSRAAAQAKAAKPGGFDTSATFSSPASSFLPVGASGTPAFKEWDHAAAVKYGYKASGWVYAALFRLAAAVSSVPWRVMIKKGEEWSPAAGHEYEEAIEFPNNPMSRQFLMQLNVLSLGCGGNALMRGIFVGQSKNNPLGKLYEIWPLQAASVNVVSGVKSSPPRWIDRYESVDKRETWAPEEICHAQFADPMNPLWGMSPLRAIANTVDMDVQMIKWNRNAMGNQLVPSGAFISPNIKTQEQRDEMQALIAEHYASPDNARKPLILPGEGAAQAAFLRMALSPAEMDWIASRRVTLKEICAALGILPALLDPEGVGNLGGGKVMEEAVKYMWENGAMVYLTAIEDAFNAWLVPRKQRSSMWIHFDTSGVTALQDNLSKRLEAHAKAIASGVPPNRSFVMLDLPVEPVPGGDRSFIPVTLTELDPAAQTNAAVDAVNAAMDARGVGKPPPKPGDPTADQAQPGAGDDTQPASGAGPSDAGGN